MGSLLQKKDKNARNQGILKTKINNFLPYKKKAKLKKK
jgi:hypothetical protein